MTPPGRRPTLADYQAAVARLDRCSEDPLLKRCRPECGADGLPGADGGTFGAVYRLHDPQDGRDWALKCFLRAEPGRERRYREIAACLAGDRGTWRTEVRHLANGLWVREQWWPVVVMEWVAGARLTDWIDVLLDERPERAGDELRRVAHRFAVAVHRMHRSGISHGDLQSGNVLVTSDTQVRFVDYDAMTVPAWTDRPREDGHPDFRLPREGERGPDGATELRHTASGSARAPFGDEAALAALHRDRFPSHVIHASLLMLSHDVSLWSRLHQPGADHLLVSRTDFRDPAGSRGWPVLLDHERREVRSAALRLRELLDTPADEQPDLEPRPEVASVPGVRTSMVWRSRTGVPASPRPFLDPGTLAAPGGAGRTAPPSREAPDVPETSGRPGPSDVLEPPVGGTDADAGAADGPPDDGPGSLPATFRRVPPLTRSVVTAGGVLLLVVLATVAFVVSLVVAR
ncbi:protein kinase domain-containing protein [Streptomyces sp. bgisy022]|uniref:protein kinase domain-containing protein n=1 Tax=Streptomyces sp. bgisy022 TaxID=3413769 RepID=UPI003D72DA88